MSSTYLWTLGWLLLATAAPLVFLGWTPTTLISGSMQPSLVAGDVVLVAGSDGRDLAPGTVVTFDDPARPGRLLTHRIVGLHPRGGYRTKGDANTGPDSTPVQPDDIRGVGRLAVPRVGLPMLWAQNPDAQIVAFVLSLLAALAVRLRTVQPPLPATWSLPAPTSRRGDRQSGRTHRGQLRRGLRLAAIPAALALVLAVPLARTSAAFSDTTANPANSLAAASTFGADFVQSFGTSGCSTTTTTLTVPAAGVTAGHTLIVRLMLREPNAGAVSVADSGGNSYTIDASVQGGRTRTVLASAYIQTPLASGQTVTITHPTGSKVAAASAAEFTDIDPNTRVDVSATATSNTAAPSASVTTTWSRTLVYAAEANRDNVTLTEAAGWSTDRHVAGACAGQFADDHGAFMTRLTPGGATYNPTLSAAKDWTVAVVAYKVVDNVRPPAPTLSGSPGDAEALLSWSPVTDAAGPVTYRLYRDGGLIYSGSSPSYADSTANNSTAYDYVVRAVDANGNASVDSNTVVLTPSVGASIRFVQTVGTAVCGGATTVVTIGAGGIAKHSTLVVSLVLREPPLGAVTFTDSRGNTYRSDADLQSGKVRTVVASAYVTTALQTGDTVTVTHPSGKYQGVTLSQLSGVAQTGHVDTAVTNAGDSISPTATVTTTAVGAFVFSVLGLENAPTFSEPAGWTQHQRMTANCGGNATSHTAYRRDLASGSQTYAPTLSGAVSWTEAIVAYTPAGPDETAPDAPVLTATGLDGAVDVTWPAVADSRSEPVSYRLYRDGSQVYSGAATSFTDTGLVNSTPYAYTARTVDAVGNESALSTPVNGTPVDDIAPPAAPTLSGTKGTGQNTLTWTAVTDPSTPVSYRLLRGATVVYEGTNLTYTDTVAGTPSYTVTAIDGASNESQPSNSFTPEPGTVTALAIVNTTAGVSGYLRQGGAYYVYANVTAGSTSVAADVSTVTAGQTAVPLAAGSYTAEGVTYGLRSALLTASNPLSEGSRSFSVTPSGGNASNANVTVDNTAPTGTDIQLVNKVGGSAGVPEQGDSVVFTFSEPISANSILAGWAGTSTTVTGYVLHNGATDDTVYIRNAANTADLPLGTVDTNGDPVSANATFSSSTMVMSGNTITVTFGAIDTGARTDNKTTPSVWAPSASVLDLAGNSMSTAPVTETGTPDISF